MLNTVDLDKILIFYKICDKLRLFDSILNLNAFIFLRFCSYFAKLKKDVARISPYLIADLLEINSKVGVLPHFVKVRISWPNSSY